VSFWCLLCAFHVPFLCILDITPEQHPSIGHNSTAINEQQKVY
jgi:hypothetical protein